MQTFQYSKTFLYHNTVKLLTTGYPLANVFGSDSLVIPVTYIVYLTHS